MASDSERWSSIPHHVADASRRALNDLGANAPCGGDPHRPNPIVSLKTCSTGCGVPLVCAGPVPSEARDHALRSPGARCQV